MRRIILPAALAFVLCGSLAFAQPPQDAAQDAQTPPPTAKHHQPDPHREAMQLSKRLSLTPDQTAKIEPIFAARQQKMEALAANTSLSDEDRKQQTRAIRKDTEAQLDTILTPDQQAQMKAGRHGKKGGGDEAPADAAPAAGGDAAPPSN